MTNKEIKRGEVYWVNLDPTIGSEIQKTRPAVIVSNNIQNKVSSRVVVIPITSKADKLFPFEAKISLKIFVNISQLAFQSKGTSL